MRNRALRDPVAIWLWVVWTMVLLMVGIGGVTRLTGSGLSMVDWHPLMGALPPLTDAEWLSVFERYKASPQYQQVNHWMQLGDFKRIFFWEYVHRVFGRLIGLAFAVPYFVFLMRRSLRGWEAVRGLVALVLGGAQGVLGWYMVQSGLVNEPRVSHFRLAAHLSLAFTVGAYLAWLALDRGPSRAMTAPSAPSLSAPVRPWWANPAVGWSLFALTLLQVVFGAFMAGTHAGLLYDTFPDMGGAYLPGPFFRFEHLADNLLHNPMAIHWTHRLLAWLLLVGAGAWAIAVLRSDRVPWARPAARWLLAGLALQFGLGALTVMHGVPLPLAVAHQVCGYLLLSAVTGLRHRLTLSD